MRMLLALLALIIFSSISEAQRAYPIPPQEPEYPRRGVNAECVQWGCFHGHCDTDEEIEEITIACYGVRDGICVSTLCNQRGNCNSMSQFLKYANLCAGRH